MSSSQNAGQVQDQQQMQRVFPYNATVDFDPPKDGNCQFAAIAYHLNSSSICSGATHHTVRAKVVDFLSRNPYTSDEATHLCNFVTNVKGNGREWSSYLETMKSDHIFGDHITLYAATKVFGVHFIVLSSAGADATVFVSEKSVSQCIEDSHIMVLGHLAETDIELTKEHYVCLSLSSDDIRSAMQCLLQRQTNTTVNVESNSTQEPGTSDQCAGTVNTGGPPPCPTQEPGTSV